MRISSEQKLSNSKMDEQGCCVTLGFREEDLLGVGRTKQTITRETG